MPAAQRLHAGQGGFTRQPRGQPHLRPMHTAAPGAVLGDPTSVEERPIGYGAAESGDGPQLWVESIEAVPLVAVHVVDDEGQPHYMTGAVSTFVSFARQIIALHDGMPQPQERGAVYEEPEEPYAEPHQEAV
jgi:hypothetical protein